MDQTFAVRGREIHLSHIENNLFHHYLDKNGIFDMRTLGGSMNIFRENQYLV